MEDEALQLGPPCDCPLQYTKMHATKCGAAQSAFGGALRKSTRAAPYSRASSRS